MSSTKSEQIQERCAALRAEMDTVRTELNLVCAAIEALRKQALLNGLDAGSAYDSACPYKRSNCGNGGRYCSACTDS